MKGSLCYSESTYVQFRLNKCILQELWIFFACMYTGYENMSTTTVTWKIVCHWLLPPPMPLLWNRLFISMCDKNPCQLETCSQLSKTGYKPCLLYYTVTSIEQKVFTFKHSLNRVKYIQAIIPLQVQRINGNSCYKRC